MATDQGKTANVNGLALMAEITAKSIPQTGTTVFRPPYTPVAIGALAGTHRGRHFQPMRLTPAHALGAGRARFSSSPGNGCARRTFRIAGETDWLASVDPRS